MIQFKWRITNFDGSRGFDRFNRALIKIGDKMLKNSEKLAVEAADDLVTYIRKNWSMSPSAPGNPPGILTGNLDSSISVEKVGRGEGGRFAGKNSVYRYVRIDTTRGEEPLGRGHYEDVLEYGYKPGGKAPRPFIQPAVDYLQTKYPQLAKQHLGRIK